MDEYLKIPEELYKVLECKMLAFLLCYLKTANINIDDDYSNNYSSIIDFIRCERYNKESGFLRNIESTSKVKHLYYTLRPYMPINVRKYFQKIALIKRINFPFPSFPNDYTVDNLYRELLFFLLKELNLDSIPFIWYWPYGKKSCLIMTHDIESATGLEFSENMGKLDKQYGFRSSFEFIPEERYCIPTRFFEKFICLGHEVCVHDLNHDGHLFRDKNTFLERVKKINRYAELFGAIGFRSAVMYRNIDWYNYFKFCYDMSVPNAGHLDPQFGGSCTVMPYYISSVLELPLTTIQDYPLYFILKNNINDFWESQVNSIASMNGLISFNIHPDYQIKDDKINCYIKLLEYLVKFVRYNNVWMALPKEVFHWWQLRKKMRILLKENKWIIQGEGSENARIAYASIKDSKLSIHINC